MEQGLFDMPMGTITLPELMLGPVKYPIGKAYKLMRTGTTEEILDEQMVNISPKVKVRCVKLGNGERIIISNRKKIDLPEGVDGVLQKDESGSLNWSSHRLIDHIKAEDLRGYSDRAVLSWNDAVSYRAEVPPAEEDADKGLRAPQLGALFSVGAHWSLNKQAGTIVMPTGTGKTETMLATLVAHCIPSLLIAVPSKALRAQTADKFLKLGLLKTLNIISNDVEYPVVGIIERRPKSSEELQIFRDCNVTVGVMSSLAGGTAKDHHKEMSDIIDTLVVDEAHHIGATTWQGLKQAFNENRILQFTATPFRNDGKLVDGAILYSYALKAAQEDGYFKPIQFVPVHEFDDELADKLIADTAIQQLRSDIVEGHPHLMMARCASVERAMEVAKIYEDLAPDLSPLLIHSELEGVDERVEALKRQESKIVICVNMLGEGVDVPALKIAAIHDKHKSLAVLLQFIGRFTRKGDPSLGDATVIANIANADVSEALEQLYSEDSDWNELLSELSSEAAVEHAEFIKFLENSTLSETGDENAPGVSEQSLKPTFSTLFYHADEFHPKRFHEGLSKKYEVIRVWHNEEAQTLYFVTRARERVKWSRTKELEHIDWNLFVLHYDPMSKLLYLQSSSKESNFASIAAAVGAKDQVSGENMFRSLGNIGRLVFNNLGVTKHGRRNLSFAMYTGADVKQALSETEKQGSRKSNISGYGWENGTQITIGCSYKGRVWSKAAGTIPKFIKWAEAVGAKLVDETIDTKSIIKNVLIPEYATEIPDYEVLNIDWPVEILSQSEERFTLLAGAKEVDLLLTELQVTAVDRPNKSVSFALVTDGQDDPLGEYKLTVKGEAGFDIGDLNNSDVHLKFGSNVVELAEFFRDYPPIIRFVDLSEIDGNIILKAENSGVVEILPERLEPWDWTGVDITKESIWKKGEERQDSIQWKVAQTYIDAGYNVVFDDDGSGEAADLVCLKLEDDKIKLDLVHCKFSGAAKEGKRVKDVVEVASQAVRSARWPGKLKELLRHVEVRNRRRDTPGRSLFLAGGQSDLVRIRKAERFLPVEPSITIVQPGVSKAGVTQDQSVVLGAAVEYIKQTLGVDVDVVCSN